LVFSYLKDITRPLQFAYRANRSYVDAVNMEQHFILQHLDKSGTCVRILFVDFSLAFNTIIPILLQTTTSTGAPQDCVLSQLLFSLYTSGFQTGP
ncbi:hypothetical protein M9458_002592, partial [Cirrhinus mrigala]